jgi:hypothetical protein
LQAFYLSQTSAYLIGYSIDRNKVKSDKFHLFTFLNSDFDKQAIKKELRREISFFTDVLYLQNRIFLCGNFQNNNQNEEEEANQVAFIDFN